MRILVAAFSAFIAFALLNGCPPSQPAVNPDVAEIDAMDDTCLNEMDGGNADDPSNDGSLRYPVCKSACVNLQKLGCIEGQKLDGGEDCYAICAHAEQTKKFDLHPTCVASAKTIAEVRACGPIRCGK